MRAAYAYARTRARRSTLLRPEQIEAFRGASGALAAASALRSAGIDARDAKSAARACLARFVADAERLAASWPRPGLVLAIVGLLEVENLKLGCRAVHAQLATDLWHPLWLPLGRVSRLETGLFTDAPSLRAALDRVAPLPWGEAARRALRAHEDDPAAFEMALDAFASRRLLDAGGETPGTRALAALVVRIREVDAVSRAPVRGLRPEDAAMAAVLLRRELRPDALRALATGDLTDAVRASFRSQARTVPALLEALRTRLRGECLRTFAGPPFRPACAAALLLLRLDEMQAVTAIAEAQLEREAS
jgi:hypothetical protein